MFKQKLYAGLIGGVLMLGLTLSNPAMAGKDLTEAEVPEGAMATFQKTYPKATNVEWEQTKVHMGKLKGTPVYEVKFKDEYGIGHKMLLSPEGKLYKGKVD